MKHQSKLTQIIRTTINSHLPARRSGAPALDKAGLAPDELRRLVAAMVD